MKNVTTSRLGGFIKGFSKSPRSVTQTPILSSSWRVVVQALVVYKKRNTTDAGLKPSSMTLSYNGKRAVIRLGGFTLIELLVVVLIIGILAAIAVPQYQKAVEKSRAAAIPPLLRPLAAAKKAYYMANGTHARRFDDLDVALPADCRIYDSDWYGQTATCGKIGIWLDAKYSNQVSGQLVLSDGSELALYYPVLPTGPQEQCLACPATGRAKALCEGIGFPASAGKIITSGTGSSCYQYNR